MLSLFFPQPLCSGLSDTLFYTHCVTVLSMYCVCVYVCVLAPGRALPLLLLIDVNGESEEDLVRVDLVISGEFHPN